MTVSFGNNFQDLINKPQAFAAPKAQSAQTAPAAPKKDAAPQGDVVTLDKNAKKKTLLKGVGIGAAVMAVAMPLIAGRGNIVKGCQTIFKGAGKFVEEAVEPLKQKIQSLTDEVADLTDKLARKPQEALDAVIANPKEHEGFLVKLIDMFKGSKYGQLTDKIEEGVVQAGRIFSEIERKPIL